MYSLTTNKYFKYDLVDEDDLQAFDSGFELGASPFLREMDGAFEAFGLSRGADWSQQDLLEERDARTAGFFLGIWCKEFFADIFETHEEYEAAIHATGHLATLLWAGTQGSKDDPRRAAFEEALKAQPEGGFMVYIPKRN